MMQKDYQKMEKFTRLVADLERMDQDEKLQYFIQQLCDLNHETVEILKTGNIELLYKMNETVENIYAVQSKGKEEAYQAIDEDCQIIYKNFTVFYLMWRCVTKNAAKPGFVSDSAAFCVIFG